jgi:hypothetical protein
MSGDSSLFRYYYGEEEPPKQVDLSTENKQVMLYDLIKTEEGVELRAATPDKFFVVSAGTSSNTLETSYYNQDISPVSYDDGRKRVSDSMSSDLNFYIEILDSSLSLSNIPLFRGDYILKTLRLGVNPRSLSFNSENIITKGQSLTRWVEEHWGEEISTITFEGSTLAFIMIPGTQGSNVKKDSGGLSTEKRNLTYPFQEFQHFINLIKVNGLIYQDLEGEGGSDALVPTIGQINSEEKFEYFQQHPRYGMVRERRYISLKYDYGQFLGYFENFQVSENSSNPFIYEYSVTFKAEKVLWR